MKMSSFESSYKILNLYRAYSRSKSVVAAANTNNWRVVVSSGSGRQSPVPRVGSNYVFRNTAPLAGLRYVHVFASSNRLVDDNKAQTSPPPSSQPQPQPPSPRPPSPLHPNHFSVWAKLVLGSVVSLVLALWTPKWATLLKIGGEAEVIIKEGEQVVELVEKVADVVEKVSEEVADSLPDGNKFKDTAFIIDRLSKEAAKDAQIADQILHKLDVVKQDLEDLEEEAEPFIHKIDHDSNQVV